MGYGWHFRLGYWAVLMFSFGAVVGFDLDGFETGVYV